MPLDSTPERCLAALAFAALLVPVTAVAQAHEVAQARPLGIEMGAPSSCSAAHARLGKPPATVLGTVRFQPLDSDIASFEAIAPEDLFPEAQTISVTCRSGVVFHVVIAVRRVRPGSLELATLAALLERRYRHIEGKVQPPTEDTRIAYTGGDVTITLSSSATSQVHLIIYQHVARASKDPSAATDIERVKRQRDSL
jgi:hypothetical protein